MTKTPATDNAKAPPLFYGKIRLTEAQARLIATMKPDQWYGDHPADDVLKFPKEWNPRTFRQMLRKLSEKGILEDRMKEYIVPYAKFTAFNVRLKPNTDHVQAP